MGPVVEVTLQGDVLVEGAKVVLLGEGRPPKALEAAEKMPPEIIPVGTHANLCIYRHTRLLANVRTSPSDSRCSIFFTSREEADFPNFKFGGVFSFRGKEFSFSKEEDLKKSNFESLLLPQELKMAGDGGWILTAGDTTIELSFDDAGLLSGVRLAMGAVTPHQ